MFRFIEVFYFFSRIYSLYMVWGFFSYFLFFDDFFYLYVGDKILGVLSFVLLNRVYFYFILICVGVSLRSNSLWDY